MFDRGGRSQEGPLNVAIVLRDGQELHGKLVAPPGRPLLDVLNGGSDFIEFEPTGGGGRMMIAKSALQVIKPTNLPPRPDLWAGPTEGSDFDPYAALGIKAGATREEVHDAYIKLAKTYHPDRYAAADLPQEVREYLSVMARRVNAAYDACQSAQRRENAKADAVFTKAGQGV
jgi:hypothetical protein